MTDKEDSDFRDLNYRLRISETERVKLEVILADIIQTLSNKELSEVKFQRARKKGINHVEGRIPKARSDGSS